MQGHPPNHRVAVAQAGFKCATPPSDPDLPQMFSFHQDPAAGRTDLPYVILGLFLLLCPSQGSIKDFKGRLVA